MTKDNLSSPSNAASGFSAEELYQRLARQFPVCTMSDEFYYFPQQDYRGLDRGSYDDFSPSALQDLGQFLQAFERDTSGNENALELEERISVVMVRKAVRALREQLTEVRGWETQPTFYLAVAGIGLAQALEAADLPEAWPERTSKFPAFLDQAGRNLRNVPEVFRELGLAMTSDLKSWLHSLQPEYSGLEPCLAALERYSALLIALPPKKDFRQPLELFRRIAREHLGCGMELEEIETELVREVRETEAIMQSAAAALGKSSWREALDSLPLPELPEDGLIGLYRREIENLRGHCREQGFIPENCDESSPVRVRPVPSYLKSIRSAAAYSLPPRHPPAGGTFYLIESEFLRELPPALVREAHLLSAHETYPGHHLLDTCRWAGFHPVRSPLEFPLYYEGWACLAEELLFHTGLFSGPADQLLLARRRYWRAKRGQADLGLQTGKMNFAEAAARIEAAGMSRDRALKVVKQYSLNPGYELCYTIGLRRFRALFERWGRGNPARFVRAVLTQGEIGFDNLELVFRGQR